MIDPVGMTARRAAGAGAVCMLASLAVLGYAVLVPVRGEVSTGRTVKAATLPPSTRPVRRVEALLLSAAGKELIRPAQVQAAVKDTGVARELAKKLKLQGTIDMDGQYVAYIRLEDKPAAAVREGASFLDFTVKKIEAGRVVLTLEGVEVSLTQ